MILDLGSVIYCDSGDGASVQDAIDWVKSKGYSNREVGIRSAEDGSMVFVKTISMVDIK